MLTTDYTHTNNPRSIYLAEMAIPFPEWIKGREIPSAPMFEKLASVAFADRANRRLPVSDKDSAFFSAIDYFANADAYPESAFDAIKEASDHFGIGDDIAPYAEFFAGVFEKKAASAETAVDAGRFAISTHLGGSDFQLLPLNDAYEVTKAARDLTKMVAEDRIHYLMFVDAAREIVKAAAELEAEIHPFVLSAGTERFEDLDKAATMIESRRSVTAGHEGAFEAYVGAIKSAAAGTITPEECMQKIAATDSALGLRYDYNPRSRIPLPHAIVFGGPTYSEVEKVASERVMVRGVPVPLAAIAAIPGIDVQFKLEKSAASELLELRSGASAIPLSLAIEKWAADDQQELLRLALAVA